jgi:hypothetical protein
MKITMDVINILTPKHGRTTCSDSDLANGLCFIAEEKLQGVVVKRWFDPAPRCNRCFLLSNLDQQLDLRISIEVSIGVKAPNFKVEEIRS